MPNSDYIYYLVRFLDHDCLIIEDLDRGGMTVTNNIENVVAEIEEQEQIDSSKYLIVYKDTEDNWDGWEKGHGFVSIGSKHWQNAVTNYLQIKKALLALDTARI